MYNSASLHPAIDPFPQQYYKKVHALKGKIKKKLSALFSPEFEYYLLHNTTSALTTVLGAVYFDNSRLAIDPSGYRNYKILQERVFRSRSLRNVRLVSHIDPINGNKSAARVLASTRRELVIVDAAQSIGGYGQAGLFEAAAIILFPFHKNLGISTGMGCIAMNKSWLENSSNRRLAEYCAMAEDGCLNYNLVEDIYRRISALRSGVVNKVKIQLSSDFLTYLKSNNLRLVTRRPIAANIVSITSANDLPLADFLDTSKLKGKYFKRENIIRYSFHSWSLNGSEPCRLIIDNLDTAKRHH
jgi:hypothetical protein